MYNCLTDCPLSVSSISERNHQYTWMDYMGLQAGLALYWRSLGKGYHLWKDEMCAALLTTKCHLVIILNR